MFTLLLRVALETGTTTGGVVAVHRPHVIATTVSSESPDRSVVGESPARFIGSESPDRSVRFESGG